MKFNELREQFPQLKQKVGEHNLVYLDSAATTLKPQCVVDRLNQYYLSEVSNVHRGAHYFSNLATENYEKTRKKVANFIKAKDEEIIFTSGTTDGVNLLAYALDSVVKANQTKSDLKNKNEILLSEAEHHSNIVPWYWFAQRHDFKIKTLPVDEHGRVQGLKEHLTEKTFLVGCVHMSNTLGTLSDVRAVCQRAQEVGAFSLIDAAQSISFLDISVKDIACDFLCFSSHKLFGPEGLGVLYGRLEFLNSIGYYKGGGSMISEVGFDKISFLSSPQKFEAGTPAIGPVIAFGAALDFFQKIPKEQLQSHEKSLVTLADQLLREVPAYRPFGSVEDKKNILTFNLEDCHPADLGSLINEMGVAVRVGHHCTQPLLKAHDVKSTLRASFSIYNNEEDVYSLVKSIKKARELLV